MTIPARPATVNARPGLLARLKLTEPARLYAYTVLVVATVGLQLAGLLSGQWVQYLEVNGGLLLGVGAAAEAIRASVYSPATHTRDLLRANAVARSARTLAEAEGW